MRLRHHDQGHTVVNSRSTAGPAFPSQHPAVAVGLRDNSASGRASAHRSLFSPQHHPPTHRRAGGTGVGDLVLLGATLLLSHGTQPVLHRPEQHGVQVSILARGHLNDCGGTQNGASARTQHITPGKASPSQIGWCHSVLRMSECQGWSPWLILVPSTTITKERPLTEVSRIVVGGAVQAQPLQVGDQVGDHALEDTLALAQDVELKHKEKCQVDTNYR